VSRTYYMSFEVELDRDVLQQAREIVFERPPTGKYRHELQKIGVELVEKEYVPAWRIEDILCYSGLPYCYPADLKKLIKSLVPTVSLLEHPRSADTAFGGEYFRSADVAYACHVFWRLGFPIDLAVLTGPLRSKLKNWKDHPFLTRNELSLLWSDKEDRVAHVFKWPEGTAPNTEFPEEGFLEERLPNGRLMFTFGYFGRYCEVIASSRWHLTRLAHHYGSRLIQREKALSSTG